MFCHTNKLFCTNRLRIWSIISIITASTSRSPQVEDTCNHRSSHSGERTKWSSTWSEG